MHIGELEKYEPTTIPILHSSRRSFAGSAIFGSNVNAENYFEKPFNNIILPTVHKYMLCSRLRSGIPI